MKLKDLKALVAEEYNKFLAEKEEDEKDTKDDKEKDDAPKHDAPKDDKPKGDDASKDDAPKDDAPKDDAPKAPKKPKAPKVDVGPKDLDIAGEENPEETLRAIYDMLKDFFEGDKEEDKPEMPKMNAEPPMPGGMDMGSPANDGMMALQERFRKLANIKGNRKILK